jgi:hypothetical protein
MKLGLGLGAGLSSGGGGINFALDDDFSAYADQTAAEAAGYTPQSGIVSFDAASDQWTWAGDAGLDFQDVASGLVSGRAYTLEWTHTGRTQGELFFQHPVSNNIGSATSDGTHQLAFTYDGSGVLRLTSGFDFNGSVTELKIFE